MAWVMKAAKPSFRAQRSVSTTPSIWEYTAIPRVLAGAIQRARLGPAPLFQTRQLTDRGRPICARRERGAHLFDMSIRGVVVSVMEGEPPNVGKKIGSTCQTPVGRLVEHQQDTGDSGCGTGTHGRVLPMAFGVRE